MPYYLYLSKRPTSRGFDYIHVKMGTGTETRKWGDRNYNIERDDNVVPQFLTSDRANLLKIINKHIVENRAEHHELYDGKDKYAVSERDVALVKLLVKQRKDYKLLRTLLDMSRDEVVLMLEIAEISDAILK